MAVAEVTPYPDSQKKHRIIEAQRHVLPLLLYLPELPTV